MNILIVEDDQTTQNVLSSWLKDVAKTQHAFLISEADAFKKDFPRINLILLDEILPDGSGLQWYKSALSEHKEIIPPCLFISTVDEVEFIESCYRHELVLDYVVKPLHQGELVAKVRRILKLSRTLTKKIPQEIIANDRQRTLTVSQNTVHLTPKEFSLWQTLSLAYPRPLTRARIFQELWGKLRTVEKTIDVHMCNFRKKILPLGIYVHLDTKRKTYSMEFQLRLK